MHGDDGRLRQRANKNQHDADRRRQPGWRCGDQLRQQICARDGAENDDADQHGQAAGRGDQQRLNGGLAAGDALGVVADQEEGQHGGELPEHVEHQHVVADHQPEHRPGERDQLGGETRQSLFGVPVVMVEVVGAVEQHQRADAQHEHAHDRRERVEPQRDVHRQLGHPGHLDAAGLPGAGPVQCHPDQGSERDEGQRVERHPPPPVHQQGSQRGGDRVGEKDGEHGTPNSRGVSRVEALALRQSTWADTATIRRRGDLRCRCGRGRAHRLDAGE